MLILPVAVFAVVSLSLLNGRRPAREAALVAASVVGLAVLLFTVVLSWFHALVFGWLVACWAVLLATLIVVLRGRIAEGFRRLRSTFSHSWGPWEWVTAVVVAAFAVGTLLSALLYPIVNSDSLTYHMPRVFFWFQNHSVARYPTSEGRQLFSSPFAEYGILQLKILAGGTDRLSNTVQWFSYIFSVMAVSLIALRLGAERRGQQVAAMVAAATPMAILQASTTQNDLAAAFWCLAAVYWIVSYVGKRPASRAATGWWALWIATAVALAIQAKPTSYLVCTPFLLWLAVVAICRDGLRPALALAGVVIALVLTLNASWYVDNARLLGGDFLAINAPGGNAGLLVKDLDPSSVFTNALKNSSMMLGTPSVSVNSAIAEGVRAIAAVYHGDTENPGTLDRNMPSPYRIDERIAYHDVGPSPAIVALVILSGVVIALARRRAHSIAKWYLSVAGAALFLATGLIAYSYYINRVTLGGLLVFVPLVGVSANILVDEGPRWARWLIVGLLGVSIAWGSVVMLANSTNRLIPPSLVPFKIGNRDLGYWNTSYDRLQFLEHVPQYEQPYQTIAAIVRDSGFRRIGIDDKVANVPIYPLLNLLRDREFAYVGNTLLADKIRARPFSPQVVLEVTAAEESSATPDGAAGRGSGTLLYGPVTAADMVLRLYRVP